MKKDIKDLKVLISSNDLYKRIKELADEINNTYPKNELLNLICILKGGIMFFAEISKHLKMPVKMEFISLSSYGSSEKSSNQVKANNLNLPEFCNENVLIVEDIIDTGLSMDFLLKFINKNCKAKTVKIAALLNKKCARKFNIKPDFSAFDVEDKFVAGFGLDYQQIYRNLDYIGYFE